MKCGFVLVARSLVGVGMLALAGCGSPMTTKETRHSDSGITSVTQTSLQANDKVKAREADVGSPQGVVRLIGRVSSEKIKSEAETVARDTKGVKDVHNKLLVGRKYEARRG